MTEDTQVLAAATLAAALVSKLDGAAGTEGIIDAVRIYRTIFRKLKRMNEEELKGDAASGAAGTLESA